MRKLERLDRVRRNLADDEELALKRIGHHHTGAAPDKHLPDHRLDFARRIGDVGIVHRHVAPAEQHLPLVLDRTLDLVFAGQTRCRLARQKHHADPVLPGLGERHALLGHFFAEEAIGNLNQDAGAVAELRVEARRAAMREVAQNRHALLDDRVRLPPLDVRDEADAAGVVLVCRVVQTLSRWRR